MKCVNCEVMIQERSTAIFNMGHRSDVLFGRVSLTSRSSSGMCSVD